MKTLILLAITSIVLSTTPSFAAQVQLPPGTLLPPPGAVRPPSLNQPWIIGPPQPQPQPESPRIEVAPNPFLQPSEKMPTEKEAECRQVAGITTCQR